MKYDEETITFEASENKDTTNSAQNRTEGTVDPKRYDNATAAGINVDKLTNKKKQYLMNEIIDKNGAYSYLEDPNEYKKARKRL